MTLNGFQRLLDTYGHDPARWPAHSQREAEALLAWSAAAQAALQEARALAALLDSAASDRLPDVAEIVARATSHAQDRPHKNVQAPRQDVRPWSVAQPGASRRRVGHWSGVPVRVGWMPASALAACLVLGLALGAALPHPVPAGGTAVSASEVLSMARDGAAPLLAPFLGDEP